MKKERLSHNAMIMPKEKKEKDKDKKGIVFQRNRLEDGYPFNFQWFNGIGKGSGSVR